jgi:(p)ppGpp synthase/HD superfamily hydrolase
MALLPPLLEDAIALACRAHRGQVDKGGQPYILHLLRVMLKQENEIARIVGVLHDVVEDTGVTLDDLGAAGFGDQVCEAVDCLTRRKDEPYESMIARVAANPLARSVKLADLEDNMDPRRRLPGDREAQRQVRYRQAREVLQAAQADNMEAS